MSEDPRAQTMFEAAAEVARERIRSDRETASPRLRAYLEHVHRHLFDPGYDSDSLRRAFGLGARSRKVRKAFRDELNCGVREYLGERRMETAQRLLLDTDFRLWQISLLIGYRQPSTFNQSFRLRYGETPSAFRRRHRQAPAQADETTSVQRWRLAVAGGLSLAAAKELIARLEARYPRAVAQPAPPNEPGSQGRCRVTIRGEVDAGLYAGAIWETLRRLPRSEQRRLVREQVAFETPALFHLLLEQSRKQRRRDRRRGLELAELALESLEGSAETLNDGLAKYRAQGWAWVGNARRLVEDLLGAEDAFTFAEAEWNAAGGGADPLIAAEIGHLKAELRVSQRRLSEAQALNKKALETFRSASNDPLLTRALILRAAISEHSGDAQGKIQYLREAIGRIDSGSDSRLALALHLHLMSSYVAAGAHRQAESIRRRAKELCGSHGGKRECYQLRWIEGRLRRAEGDPVMAEALILDAYSGLMALGAERDAALAGMDLAARYLEQQRSQEALAMLSAAVPVVESLQITRETLAALAWHRDAVEGNQVSEKTVEIFRRALQTARLAALDLAALDRLGEGRREVRF